MKLSATMTMWLAIVFAGLCLAYGIHGMMEQAGMPAGQEREDARGFAFYFLFLGAVGVAGAFISWWMAREVDREERRGS